MADPTCLRNVTACEESTVLSAPAFHTTHKRMPGAACSESPTTESIDESTNRTEHISTNSISVSVELSLLLLVLSAVSDIVCCFCASWHIPVVRLERRSSRSRLPKPAFQLAVNHLRASPNRYDSNTVDAGGARGCLSIALKAGKALLGPTSLSGRRQERLHAGTTLLRVQNRFCAPMEGDGLPRKVATKVL